MKRSKTSKQWMREHVNDPYVKRAKSEGWRSRAAFKLMQMAERDRLLRRGAVVVDLGAAPGGWAQVAAQRAGREGCVVAVDLLEMAPLPGVTFIQGDFGEAAVLAAVEEALGGRAVDLVLSDMAPNISGIPTVDQARAMQLAELALEFACRHLKPGGALVVKVFQGSGFEGFLREMRARFGKVVTRKPEASRSRSPEIYLLGTGLRAGL